MNEKINDSKDMQPILDAMLEVSKENMKNLIGDCLSNATLGVFSGKFLVKKTWFMISFCLFKNIKSFCFFKFSKSKFADFTV